MYAKNYMCAECGKYVCVCAECGKDVCMCAEYGKDVCMCVCDRNQELNQELKNIIQLKRDSEPKINEQTNTVEEN